MVIYPDKHTEIVRELGKSSREVRSDFPALSRFEEKMARKRAEDMLKWKEPYSTDVYNRL